MNKNLHRQCLVAYVVGAGIMAGRIYVKIEQFGWLGKSLGD